MQIPEAHSEPLPQGVPGDPQPRASAKQAVQQRFVPPAVTKTLHMAPAPQPAPHTAHVSGVQTKSRHVDAGGHSRSSTAKPAAQEAEEFAAESHTRRPSASPQQAPASGVHSPASAADGSERRSRMPRSGMATPPSA